MIPALNAIFGNKTAAAVLLFLENYGSGHASRIARTYAIPVSVVQDQLRKFEDAGVLISRTVGRTRVFEFNPRNPTAKRLREFLVGELKALPDELISQHMRERQRPRRTGKNSSGLIVEEDNRRDFLARDSRAGFRNVMERLACVFRGFLARKLGMDLA